MQNTCLLALCMLPCVLYALLMVPGRLCFALRNLGILGTRHAQCLLCWCLGGLATAFGCCVCHTVPCWQFGHSTWVLCTTVCSSWQGWAQPILCQHRVLLRGCMHLGGCILCCKTHAFWHCACCHVLCMPFWWCLAGFAFALHNLGTMGTRHAQCLLSWCLGGLATAVGCCVRHTVPC